MLAPHELKNKTFTKSFKGYSPAEVEDYIDFLISKYTEIYKENSELDRKLRVVVNNLDEIKDEEESIRSTLLSAQKMAERIVGDANERADIITGAIKDRCDAVVAEFKEKMQKEKEEMWLIRTRILDFKKTVFDLYRRHIEELQELSVNEIEDIVLPDENVLVAKIFSEVKSTIEDEIKANKEKEPNVVDAPALSGDTVVAQPSTKDEKKQESKKEEEIKEEEPKKEGKKKNKPNDQKPPEPKSGEEDDFINFLQN